MGEGVKGGREFSQLTGINEDEGLTVDLGSGGRGSSTEGKGGCNAHVFVGMWDRHTHRGHGYEDESMALAMPVSHEPYRTATQWSAPVE
jgi:hypothetical protein